MSCCSGVHQSWYPIMWLVALSIRKSANTLEPLTGFVYEIDYLVTMAPVIGWDMLRIRWTGCFLKLTRWRRDSRVRIWASLTRAKQWWLHLWLSSEVVSTHQKWSKNPRAIEPVPGFQAEPCPLPKVPIMLWEDGTFTKLFPEADGSVIRYFFGLGLQSLNCLDCSQEQ